MKRLGQCNYRNFEAITTYINSSFFSAVNRSESSSFRACPRSQPFMYYPAVVERTVANTVFMERGDHTAAISACRSQRLMERGRGMERISQNKASGVLQSSPGAVVGRNSVCVRRLSDRQGFHQSVLRSRKGDRNVCARLY